MSPALASVGLSVPSIGEAVERFNNLGLPVVASGASRLFGADQCSLGVGQHRLNLIASGDSDWKTIVGTPSGPFPYFSLRVEDLDPYRMRKGFLQETERDGSLWVALPKTGTIVSLIVEQPVESLVGPSGMSRIESLPWAVANREEAKQELAEVLGLSVDPQYSDLVFPDLQTTNSLVFLGQESYLDLNETIGESGPIGRHVSRRGNGQFAVVLEPEDLDAAADFLASRGVPTVTPAPVELRVLWPDGRNGRAARILSIERSYLFGARVFLSEPTFPWPTDPYSMKGHSDAATS